MIRNITVALMAMAFLCTAAAGPCFALIGVHEVSPAKAKELGITIRTERTGPSIYVWIEFKAEGALKDYTQAHLSMTDGDRSLAVTLDPKKQPDGKVAVFFSAAPATVPKCTIMILVRDGSLGNGLPAEDEGSCGLGTTQGTGKGEVVQPDDHDMHADGRLPTRRGWS